jgi:sporulation protein YlmC with PRC-barrel domain
VNVVVAGKHALPQWLSMEAAILHCTEGIGIWQWASNDQDTEPDVVMACCGDTPTLEILAAVSILREHLPDLKIRVINGYHIQATDGEIGHVEDFIIDYETWAIRYLIVDTVNWWSGKKVLLSPQWIERVSWNESKVFINLPREIIQRSPEYIQDTVLMRDYETRLHQHYNRQGYWVDSSKDLVQIR